MAGPMLWRSPQAPQVTFLGSIHVLEGSLPDWVFNEKERADRVVFEADLNKWVPPPQAPEGSRIPDVDFELWLALEEIARRVGMDEETLESTRPLYPFGVINALGRAALQESGIVLEKSPDSVLFDLTEEPLDLESWEHHFQLTHVAPPLQEGVASLREALKRNAFFELPDRVRRAIRKWHAGEPEAVLSALGFDRRFFETSPVLAAGLFPRRHALWLPMAKFYIETAESLGNRILFVVGCSHLVGPHSFLRDLEKECGFSFRRV